MSYMYRSTPEILRFHPIPPFNFSFIVPLSRNLRPGIVLKTSFKTRVTRMGLGSFVNINIFVMKYFFKVCLYFPFLSNLLNQNLQNVKTPKKENSGISFNDILLIFGLRKRRRSME